MVHMAAMSVQAPFFYLFMDYFEEQLSQYTQDLRPAVIWPTYTVNMLNLFHFITAQNVSHHNGVHVIDYSTDNYLLTKGICQYFECVVRNLCLNVQ